jgi:3-hydroxyisobutyrate dehydrogenase-like beta-hydroxyacid dehydrogenase
VPTPDPVDSSRIGILGVGRMGLPMCARLAGSGRAVLAMDRRREARPAVTAAGADWTDSLAELGARCDVVITVLPGPAEVAAVRDELVGALAPGSTWIDMSTATPTLAEQIARHASARGIRTLDAPMGGGPPEAGDGRLVVFVGGARADVDAQRPLLSTVARQVLHVGEAGAGYTVKLLVNLLWFGQAVAGAETLALAVRAGLDPETFRLAVGQSAAASRFMERDAPALMRGDDLTSFSLAGCVEELSAVLRLGEELEVPLVLGERVGDLYADALRRYGDVDGELLAARLVTERARVAFGSSRT